MATVSMFLPSLSGTTGLVLWLRKTSDYSVVNTGGDALTESSTSGWFTATVAETWTEQLSATVIDGDGLVPAAGWLGVGSLIVSDVRAELDPAALRAALGMAAADLDTQLDAIAAGGGDAEQATLEAVQTTVDAMALSLAGTRVTVTSRVAGSTITAYIGDDFRVRSGTQLAIRVTDPAGALYDRLVVITAANLAFGASRVGKSPGEITGTIASMSYATNVTTLNVEVTACGSGLSAAEFLYQIQSTQTQGSDSDDYVELEGTLELKQRTVSVGG